MKTFLIAALLFLFSIRTIAVENFEQLDTIFEKSSSEWLNSLSQALSQESSETRNAHIRYILLHEDFWKERHPRDSEFRTVQSVMATRIRKILVDEFSFPTFDKREIVESRAFREELSRKVRDLIAHNHDVGDNRVYSSVTESGKGASERLEEPGYSRSISDHEETSFDSFNWIDVIIFLFAGSILAFVFYSAIGRRK
jgi:hypothetical protein